MPKHWTHTREGKARLKQIHEARRLAKGKVRLSDLKKELKDPTPIPGDEKVLIGQALEPVANLDYNRGFDQGVRSALSRVLRALGDIL